MEDQVTKEMNQLIVYLEGSNWYDKLDDSEKLYVRAWFRTLYANIRTRRQLAQVDPVVKLHELFDN